MRIARSVRTAPLLLLLSTLAAPARAQQPPSDPEADAAYAAREFGRAAQLYAKAAEASPKNPRLWYQLGMAHHSQSKWADAAAAMEKALAAGLKNPSALYNAACAFARAGREAPALEALAASVAAQPAAAAGLQQDPDLASLRKSPRFADLASKVEAAVHPCRGDARAHELDFWIGEWDVLMPNGQPAGRSSVQSILDGCVVFENWTGAGGGEGKSFNLFDRGTGQWRQTWVSSSGPQVDFRGGLQGSSMVYQSEARDAAGKLQRTRMTFTPLPGGKVRQLWEASSDDGKSWAVTFDGTYARRPGAPARGGAPQ